MQPHKFIIGIIMVSLFITGGLYVMFGTFADSDDSMADTYSGISERINEFNRTKFDSMDDEQGGASTSEGVYNISSTQEDDLKEEIDQTAGWRVIDVGPVRAIRRLTQYYNLLDTMIEDIAKILHIPQFFVDFAVVSFLIIVLFMTAYFIMRFQPRNN